jgi:hypothetical protein
MPNQELDPAVAQLAHPIEQHHALAGLDKGGKLWIAHAQLLDCPTLHHQVAKIR